MTGRAHCQRQVAFFLLFFLMFSIRINAPSLLINYKALYPEVACFGFDLLQIMRYVTWQTILTMYELPTENSIRKFLLKLGHGQINNICLDLVVQIFHILISKKGHRQLIFSMAGELI